MKVGQYGLDCSRVGLESVARREYSVQPRHGDKWSTFSTCDVSSCLRRRSYAAKLIDQVQRDCWRG